MVAVVAGSCSRCLLGRGALVCVGAVWGVKGLSLRSWRPVGGCTDCVYRGGDGGSCGGVSQYTGWVLEGGGINR